MTLLPGIVKHDEVHAIPKLLYYCQLVPIDAYDQSQTVLVPNQQRENEQKWVKITSDGAGSLDFWPVKRTKQRLMDKSSVLATADNTDPEKRSESSEGDENSDHILKQRKTGIRSRS